MVLKAHREYSAGYYCNRSVSVALNVLNDDVLDGRCALGVSSPRETENLSSRNTLTRSKEDAE